MNKIPIFPILLFLSLRTVKYIIFLSNVLVPIYPLKPLFLLITGFIIYYLFSSIGNRVIITTVFIIENFWILLNSIYFLYFDNYFHLLNFLFHLQTNFRNLNESISFMSAVNVVGWLPRILIALVDIPGFVLYLIYFPQIKETFRKKVSKLIFITSIIILLIAETTFTLKNEGILNILSKISRDGISLKEEKQLIARYGTLFVNTLDILYLIDENIIYNHTKKYQKIKFNSHSLNKNVILIQVESLDSSVIFTDYKGYPITPFLRYLTTNSIFFPVMVSYHFSGYTSDAEFAVINSIHPLKDIPSMRYWKNFDNSLARIFKQNNYLTYAFHNNRGIFFGRKEAYAKMGFDKFFDIEEMGLEEKGWGASDEDMFNYIKNFLKTIKSTNFFVYIITMSSHGPFTIVQNYYTNSQFDDIEDIATKNYFNSINYVDKVLSNFINFIQKEIPNTIVFIFGDHHSSLQDNSIYRRSVAIINNKIIEIVPLFIILDNPKSIFYTNEAISQLSISPTVIKLTGIEGEIKTKGEILIPPTQKTIFYLNEEINKEDIIKNLNFSIPNYIK